MKLSIFALFVVGCLVSFDNADANSVNVPKPVVQCISQVISITLKLNTACKTKNTCQIKKCSNKLLVLFQKLQKLIPTIESISGFVTIISLIKNCLENANAGKVNNIGPIIIQLLGDKLSGGDGSGSGGSGGSGSGGVLGLIPQLLGELLGGFGTGLTGIIPQLLDVLLGDGSSGEQSAGIINKLLTQLLGGSAGVKS